MSAGHQGNQAAPVTGTYQYQFGDQIVEIPSNINYQLENLIAAGGVSKLLCLCIFYTYILFHFIMLYIYIYINISNKMNDRRQHQQQQLRRRQRRR